MSTLAAVVHYTRMATEAQAMTACAARDVAFRPGFDPDYGVYAAHPMDPRTPDPLDGELSADDAHDMAVAELLTTAEPAADWIAKQCDCDQGRAPIDTLHIGAEAIMDCASVPLLHALILGGDRHQAHRAADRLAALYKRAEGELIGRRTQEILAANRAEMGLFDQSVDDTDYGDAL